MSDLRGVDFDTILRVGSLLLLPSFFAFFPIKGELFSKGCMPREGGERDGKRY